MEIIILKLDNLLHGKVNEVLEVSNYHKRYKILQDKLKYRLEFLLLNLTILQWHIKFVNKAGSLTIL